MTWLVRRRLLIAKSTAVLFLLATFLISVYVYGLEHNNAPVFLLLLAPATSLAGSFGPEILAGISRRFGPSPAEIYATSAVASFRQFYLDYFYIQLPILAFPHHMSLASQLEASIDCLEDRHFARTANEDKRRRRLTIPLFLVQLHAPLSIPDHPEVHAYLRSLIRGLRDTAEREFLAAFNEIVLQDRRHLLPADYFTSLGAEDYARIRFAFYDRYLKDDYIQQIITKLRLTEGRVRSFKASLRSIATSDKFNLAFLKDYVQKRATYRKLFLLVSEKNLPRPIQTYITQNPHFILDYSSIANLPVIGLSDRFDIFFFSPTDPIATGAALLDRLKELDPAFSAHPVRIYEIDPSEGHATNLPASSHFTQSLSYFETGAIDTTRFTELTFDQAVTLLQRSNVPLRDLFSELPPGELATSGKRAEKALLSALSQSLTRGPSGPDMFLLIRNAGRLRRKIGALKNISVDYSSEETDELFSGNINLHGFRGRISRLANEVISGLKALEGMLR